MIRATHFCLLWYEYKQGWAGETTDVDLPGDVLSVEYVPHPEVRAKFESKREEYDRRCGKGKHEMRLGFHGTKPQNIDQICKAGLSFSRVGSTTDAGFYGARIYFSEKTGTSLV